MWRLVVEVETGVPLKVESKVSELVGQMSWVGRERHAAGYGAPLSREFHVDARLVELPICHMRPANLLLSEVPLPLRWAAGILMSFPWMVEISVRQI
jgi:hypothetical protein